MKILLIYANSYFLESPVYPFGLDLIAGFLRDQGHEVKIDMPFLYHGDTAEGMAAVLEAFLPDIAGISIRNIDTAMACETFGTWRQYGINTRFFLPHAAETVAAIKTLAPEVPVVAGGAGFSVSPGAILTYIKADYGITGDGARAMERLVHCLEQGKEPETVENLLIRDKDGRIRENPTAGAIDLALHPIEREKRFDYTFTTGAMPVQSRYGCPMGCSYCVEPLITKQQEAARKKEEVIQELQMISRQYPGVSEIFFVDAEFNAPTPDFSLALLKDIIKSGLHRRFTFSSQFLPVNITGEYAGLLAETGFHVILTCDSFSDTVLKKNSCPYRESQIKKSLALFQDHGVRCSLNLIFGLPGETFETIDHTIAGLKEAAASPLFKLEYTAGARVYNRTPLCRLVEKGNSENFLYGETSDGYIKPLFFSSPVSPLEINQYIEGQLGRVIDFKPPETKKQRRIASIGIDAGQGLHEKSCEGFCSTGMDVKEAIFDYLFRKYTESRDNSLAEKITRNFLSAIEEGDMDGLYAHRRPMLSYFLSLLAPERGRSGVTDTR